MTPDEEMVAAEARVVETTVRGEHGVAIVRRHERIRTAALTVTAVLVLAAVLVFGLVNVGQQNASHLGTHVLLVRIEADQQNEERLLRTVAGVPKETTQVILCVAVTLNVHSAAELREVFAELDLPDSYCDGVTLGGGS